MNARRLIKNVLLGFVLISIGFALGKELTLRSMKASKWVPDSAGNDRVIVYYVHGSIRCITCNKIETMAHDVVERDFADAMQTGRVEWRTANFQENQALAGRYDIASSTLVLVRVEGGKEAAFKRLDKVWTLVDDPTAFSTYIADEIRAFMGGGRS